MIRQRVTTPIARTALIALVALMLCAAGCSRAPSRYESSFFDTFDTVTKVVTYAENEAEAQAVMDEIYALLHRYHAIFDIYNQHQGINGVYQVNSNAGVAPVPAERELIELIEYAKEMYIATSGKMNIAMGAVLSIWHEYREAGISEAENAALPPMDALTEAAKHTDINDVIVDSEAGTVYLADAQMRLDIGAIAKGYAAQLVIDAMRERGVKSLLLSVGGNVCAIGNRADGKSWTVGVQSPFDATKLLCEVNVDDMCLVTSGTYERFYTVDGVDYHHIIDPETLMPSLYYSSVSVLCADSGLADALSTALFNMPLEEGLALAGERGAQALWITPDGARYSTDGFDAYIKED